MACVSQLNCQHMSSVTSGTSLTEPRGEENEKAQGNGDRKRDTHAQPTLPSLADAPGSSSNYPTAAGDRASGALLGWIWIIRQHN